MRIGIGSLRCSCGCCSGTNVRTDSVGRTSSQAFGARSAPSGSAKPSCSNRSHTSGCTGQATCVAASSGGRPRLSTLGHNSAGGALVHCANACGIASQRSAKVGANSGA